MKYLLYSYCAGFGFLILVARIITLPEGFFSKAWFWFSTQRLCSFCKSRIGNAPWGWRKPTHGICPDCLLKTCAENRLVIPEARFLRIRPEALHRLGFRPEKCENGYRVLRKTGAEK